MKYRHSSQVHVMDLDLTRMTTVSVDADAGQCVTVIYGSREKSAWSREPLASVELGYIRDPPDE